MSQSGRDIPLPRDRARLRSAASSFCAGHLRERKGSILALAAAFVVLVGVPAALQFRDRERAFDADVWRSSDARVRGRMAFDLRQSKRLDGLTASEVKSLLGAPDWGVDTYLCYRVTRPYLPFSEWSEHLEVEIGADGRVVGVTQDD